jgi:hypothetical protein
MQTLEFKKKTRVARPTQQYLDFIVSGQSLRTMLKANDRDLVTPFGWSDRDVEDEIIS